MRTQVTKCQGRNPDGEKCKRWFHLHRLNRTGLCQVCGEGYSKMRATDTAMKPEPAVGQFWVMKI